MPSPGLDRREPAGDPRGVVLMLHGGAKTGLDEVGRRSASFRRTSAMRERDRHAAARSGSLAVAAALRRPRLERRRRARALARPRRPVGPRPGRGRAPRRTRSSCSATRWAPAPPSTSRTTPAWSASSRWRPGSSRSDPVDTLDRPAPDRRPRQPGPDHVARMTRAYVDRAARSPPRRGSSTWAASATTCCTSPASGTGSPCAAPSRSSRWPFPPRPTRNAWTAHDG